ncbi:hypothetical protein S7711_00982 [Stachybotrys chartarum IBT 7711]|uniref:Sodium/calcium exchanger membrane region domain-containing protein n=1 Tax=Stachybotrys chartarum (strain CBS 109288 / IBT 7711) TaxID=1280523 RepID=A0A084B0S9_STACB|nr:hypothetical protein S7711_00982 [Stachybotrys chartarum IBT 7711]
MSPNGQTDAAAPAESRHTYSSGRQRSGKPATAPPLAAVQQDTTGKMSSSGTQHVRSDHDTATEDASVTSTATRKQTVVQNIRRTTWKILTYSWVNVLLVFVPAGIAVAQVDGLHGGIVFAMNCVAIVPLAALLGYATESVATKMGDALGALLNVTFGNAVELIIFIALHQNHIRIVQASLLGSILANLLLILGMGFFFGGLRYREQVYNSTVTQMSACLLSLSVISLVLPTAFHASFKDARLADSQSLKISRGTSVVLLLVYGLYLVFQLKTHAYLHRSTPQHIVDAEAIPWPVAGWLDTSSASDSDSCGSELSDSDQSHKMVRRRMRRMLRRRSGRPPAAYFEGRGTTIPGSLEGEVSDGSSRTLRTPSGSRGKVIFDDGEKSSNTNNRRRSYDAYASFGRASHDNNDRMDEPDAATSKLASSEMTKNDALGIQQQVEFADINETSFIMESPNTGAKATTPTRRPLGLLRGFSVKDLAPTVFIQKPEFDAARGRQTVAGHCVRYGLQRTSSLPDRLRCTQQVHPAGAMFTSGVPVTLLARGANGEAEGQKGEEEEHLSRTAAVILLVVSTALVAVCAELLIGSIEEVTSSSALGETFIGLIILPIVGNAAEHVTALRVAMKNKMDLAIGVAVGSSIQIALFITPLVVMIGWIMERQMSLYFTLFETVCLFVSAFIVNFLVLDGRSNYLEGALLCAVYLIIAVVAFFYPRNDDASAWGGE